MQNKKNKIICFNIINHLINGGSILVIKKKGSTKMENKKVYYQGCISQCWRDCYAMECLERDKCQQFNEYQTKELQKERVENGR